MKTESLIIKFQGAGNQIDAETLIDTLVIHGGLIQNINQVYGDGHRKIELKIKAIEKGSFEINMELVEGVFRSLFSRDSVAYLSALVTILGFILVLYKRFKGKPVAEDEATKILQKDNSSASVPINLTINIYNNPDTRQQVSKFIKIADNDSNVAGVKLFGAGKELVKIDKKEFADLIYDDFDKETEKETIKHVIAKDAYLRIVSLSFESKKNWEFVFSGFPIKFPVQDEALSMLIDNGMRFAKGDSIKADLEITQEYDPKCDAYRNKKYRIVKFIEHIPRPEHRSLEFAE